MAQPLHASHTAPPRSSATLFGIPIGGFGWFGTLLVSVAAGFLSFFATTFLSIVVILIVDSVSRANIDYAISYRDIGLPIGLLVLVCALATLGTLWVKRILRKDF
jgi:hypothetical protein